MLIRTRIIAAMLLIESHDNAEGNSLELDCAYERLQEALDEIDNVGVDTDAKRFASVQPIELGEYDVA